ncbi:MAG: hypothetical protein RL701_3688, partial [Pseudomonadota bacterium]
KAMHQPRPQSSPAHAERLALLAAAIDACRVGRPRCRLPAELRAQVIAAIDAGAPVSAVRKACKLSGWQITRWTRAAALSGDDAAAPSAPVFESPRVLSVVDRSTREDALADGELELRIGGWRVSLRREAA